MGATSPEEYGNHYAWGETTTKDTYSLETYTYYDTTTDKFTKYCMDEEQGIEDHKSTLDQTDDAARVLWGETWRMPTAEEISELNDNCEWTWTVLNGVNGYKVTGPNGNHILKFPTPIISVFY